MKRPKTSSKKISWFSIASVFLLAIALAVGVTTSAQAATGTLDRNNYLPSLGDTNDYDRAWISVTDSAANTTASQDTITVTVKAGTNESPFILKETGGSSNVFTSSGGTITVISGTAYNSPITYPVGTTSGYVEGYGSGNHNYPALGASVVGLNLLELSANTGGNADAGANGELAVVTGDTLQLLYGGSTLDTAVVNFNSGSFSFTPSSLTAVTTSSLTSANFIFSINDPDENLNPTVKDVIGFTDSALFAGSPGTGSSRVEIEALDQTSGSRLSVGGQEVVARSIMLLETGNNTGIFAASGKVFGSTTVAASSVSGNVTVGSSSTTAYTGGIITLGQPGAVIGGAAAPGPAATFRIIETTSTGIIALVESGPLGFDAGQVGTFGTVTLAYKASLTPTTATFGTGYGTSSLLLTTVVAGSSSNSAIGPVSLFGTPVSSANYATSSTKLIKLIDGINYCLIELTNFKGTTSAASGGTGGIYTGSTNGNGGWFGGSVSVNLGTFQLAGSRSGDTIRVVYLDELRSGGTSGTVTGTVAFGISGVTGTLAQNNAVPDINDFVSFTMIDANLNTSTSTKESVAAGSGLFGGTITNRRGDHLTIAKYIQTAGDISVSYPDGYGVGTTTIRISDTGNSYVWIVPTSVTSSLLGGTFQNPSSLGSTTFRLGTQTVSNIPLVKGASSGATSFLSSASTSSFVATLDGLDNTVEISPDGTHWISIPMVETGANSSTFVGTIGFDYTAARLTTSTSATVSSLISDYTGTSTLIFDSVYDDLNSFIGTGSVVRIFDGTTQEFTEVTSPTNTILTVKKLKNTTAYDPDKTWVQVIGNDMMLERLDTTDGTVFSRIGGYFGATYRVRYNDANGASGAYLGGDTLAITTSNIGFTTYTASMTTDITGSTGPDTYVVVTLVDQDMNTDTGSKQSTYEQNASTSGTTDVDRFNQNGLGVPSGSSTGSVAGIFKNGGTAKIVYASTKSFPSTLTDQGTGGNTTDFTLVETANDSGTFKGSFQLASGTATNTGGADVLKVSNGDTVVVYNNDSPSASAADNSSNYLSTTPITVVTSLGVLTLSKSTAYLTNDTIVATVVDVDRNTNLSTENILDSALKITGANYSVGNDLILDMKETAVNSGTFLATIKTGSTTVNGIGTGGGIAGSGENNGTVRAIQDGTVNVVYTDTSPSGSTDVKQVSFSSFNATIALDKDSYPQDTNAVVTLADAERNAVHTSAESLLSDVFIQTSSSNSTQMRMVETGADTGTFVGTILVASSGGTSQYSKIQAADGDTLRITYIDDVNTTGSSRTLTDTASVTAAVATPTPAASPTPGASPTATPVTSPTATPVTSPTLPPLPSPGASPTLPPIPSPGASPTLPPVPTPGASPTATATVAPCEAEDVAVSKRTLSLKRKKSGSVTVTVTGASDCAVEGEEVTAKVISGKKSITLSSTSETTDADGKAEFTITATKKTGTARVKFTAAGKSKTVTVKVRK